MCRYGARLFVLRVQQQNVLWLQVRVHESDAVAKGQCDKELERKLPHITQTKTAIVVPTNKVKKGSPQLFKAETYVPLALVVQVERAEKPYAETLSIHICPFDRLQDLNFHCRGV